MGNINNLAKKTKKNRKIATELKEDSVAIKDAHEQLEKDSKKRSEYEVARNHLKKSISEMEKIKK